MFLNKELAKYSDVKKEMQNLTEQVEKLKVENNKIKVDNENLKKELNAEYNSNQNLSNRIEKCNSVFLRLRKC